jgi:hypothetical protein
LSAWLRDFYETFAVAVPIPLERRVFLYEAYARLKSCKQ